MFLDAGSAGGSPVAAFIIIAIYFIPAIVAVVGRHRRWLLVGLVNLLFGWTIIGWFVALALLATRSREVKPVPPNATTGSWSPTAESRVDQLQKLAALRDSGALTEEEFAAEKAKLLGSP